MILHLNSCEYLLSSFTYACNCITNNILSFALSRVPWDSHCLVVHCNGTFVGMPFLFFPSLLKPAFGGKIPPDWWWWGLRKQGFSTESLREHKRLRKVKMEWSQKISQVTVCLNITLQHNLFNSSICVLIICSFQRCKITFYAFIFSSSGALNKESCCEKFQQSWY